MFRRRLVTASSLQYSSRDETRTQQVENKSFRKSGETRTQSKCAVRVYGCGLELGQRGRRDCVDGKGFSKDKFGKTGRTVNSLSAEGRVRKRCVVRRGGLQTMEVGSVICSAFLGGAVDEITDGFDKNWDCT